MAMVDTRGIVQKHILSASRNTCVTLHVSQAIQRDDMVVLPIWRSPVVVKFICGWIWWWACSPMLEMQSLHNGPIVVVIVGIGKHGSTKQHHSRRTHYKKCNWGQKAQGRNSCRAFSISNNIKTQMFTGWERINPGVLQQIVIKL